MAFKVLLDGTTLNAEQIENHELDNWRIELREETKTNPD